MFDPQKARLDFPLLTASEREKPLIYLDSAATSQKPSVVLNAIQEYYMTSTANVHRGVHALSDASTKAWESSRKKIAQFVGAADEELIITRNATESLNGVAYGWADYHVQAGDVIITTYLEHHANIVPWQEVCRRTGARLEFVGLQAETGRLDLASLKKLLVSYGDKVALVCCTQVSNVLGTVVPIAAVVDLVREIYGSQGPKIVIDGAQAVPHIPVNFADLDVDFYAFSGHKMLGPMGVGGLVVRKALLDSGEFHPWLFGGGMIAEVHIDHTVFHPDVRERFTPGTPDVASAVGLAAACDYLSQLSMTAVATHDSQLVAYALEQLQLISQVKLIGPVVADAGAPLDRCGSVAFTYTGVHAHDVAQILDSEGVAVRSGHHCTMPLHELCHWQATVRASFAVYTTRSDIDAMCAALHTVAKVFGS